jgi:hypothetical protein
MFAVKTGVNPAGPRQFGFSATLSSGSIKRKVPCDLANPMDRFYSKLDAACRAALRHDHRPTVAHRLDARGPEIQDLALGAGSPCGLGFWRWPGLLVFCCC